MNKRSAYGLLLVWLLAGIFTTNVDAQLERRFQFGKGAASGDKIEISGRIVANQDNKTGHLQVTAKIKDGFHIYSITQEDGGPARTEIKVADDAGFKITGPFQPNKAPHSKKSEFFSVMEESQEGTVTWTAPIEFAADPASLVVKGELDGQVCDESSCQPMDSIDTTFEARLDKDAVLAPAQSGTSDGASGAAAPFSLALLLKNMGFGLIGGLILNLMPCVLPVIGLKLMSFVEQSQGSRWEAFRLNLIYALGILSVFVLLATLAVFLNLGWGEQFTNNGFKIGMVLLVFAMALSFLGVWEIPIPGFVGRGKSQDLANQEGASGAFFKGVFTTILATPCSGPFLGPVFAYTAKQAPPVTYAIMLSVGVGLALPYLLIGAFPSLIRWIPKPGAWMDTFKQLMGFVLLGTTVYLVSTVSDSLFIPVLATMFGVWFGCWWIGRTPITANLDKKVAGWVAGIATSAAIGFFAFNYLSGHSYLDWEPYSESALVSAKQEGKTVLVDFTANWCLTCQMNTVRAIDTARVGERVRELGVVPLLADWTDKSDEIKNKLAELDSVSIPLLAIYPAHAPDRPIVLRDVLSERDVLQALEQAGPSFDTVEAANVSIPSQAPSAFDASQMNVSSRMRSALSLE